LFKTSGSFVSVAALCVSPVCHQCDIFYCAYSLENWNSKAQQTTLIGIIVNGDRQKSSL